MASLGARTARPLAFRAPRANHALRSSTVRTGSDSDWVLTLRVHNTGVDEVPLRSRKINDRVLCGYAALFAEGLWLSDKFLSNFIMLCLPITNSAKISSCTSATNARLLQKAKPSRASCPATE